MTTSRSRRMILSFVVSWLAATWPHRAVAQQCPAYPPEMDHRQVSQIVAHGQLTGCHPGGDGTYVPCLIGGEPMTFELVTMPGRAIQSCDMIAWDFGDGSIGTSTGAEVVSHPYVVTSFDPYLSSFNIVATVTNALGSDTAKLFLAFPRPPCTASKTAATDPSYLGPKSGCSPSGGQCAVGENINFSVSVAPAVADPCNSWVVGWGDGTLSQQLPIADTTARANAQHFFTTPGVYNVSFNLATSLGPTATAATAATLKITVTPTGGTAAGKRRAARH